MPTRHCQRMPSVTLTRLNNNNYICTCTTLDARLKLTFYIFNCFAKVHV